MFGVVDLQKVLMVSWFSQKCSRLQAFFIFRASKPTSLAPPSSNQLTSFFWLTVASWHAIVAVSSNRLQDGHKDQNKEKIRTLCDEGAEARSFPIHLCCDEHEPHHVAQIAPRQGYSLTSLLIYCVSPADGSCRW
jgi:hypothetical protein